jgi:poly-gamma-glutamate capsule biosynthesis protein CapA/YwtB (metallophosphatase superfamily)
MTTIAATGQLLTHGPLDLASPGSQRLRAFLSEADCTVGNFEGTVETPGAWPTKTKTLHLATPEALRSIRELGFDAVTHANNHSFDLGPPGIASTKAAALGAGLAFTGSGLNIDEARAPAIVERHRKRIATLAVCLGPQPDIVYASSDRAGIAPLRMRRAVAMPDAEFDAFRRVSSALGDDLREKNRSRMGYRQEALADDQTEVFGTTIKRSSAVAPEWSAHPGDLASFNARLDQTCADADFVVVSVHSHHWDPDWSRTPHWLHQLACGLIDRGAHMVVGTGSPVVQPVAFHRGRPILGGLGNLIFHTRRPGTYDREGVSVWDSIACRARFSESGECTELAIMPVAVGRPDEGPNGLPVGPQAHEEDAAEMLFQKTTATLTDEDRGRVRLV